MGTLAPASSSGTESGQAATPDGSNVPLTAAGIPLPPELVTIGDVTVEVVTIALSPTTVVPDTLRDGYENAQAWREVSNADREDMLSKVTTASTGTVIIVVSVLPWGKGVGKAAKVGRGRIVKTILRVVGKEAKPVARAGAGAGKTVLGKFPDYMNLAESIGARRFNIPTSVWNKMSPAQQWGANQRFLDRVIARGDDIVLSNPVKSLGEATGWFGKELQYLAEHGYRLAEDGARMIR